MKRGKPNNGWHTIKLPRGPTIKVRFPRALIRALREFDADGQAEHLPSKSPPARKF